MHSRWADERYFNVVVSDKQIGRTKLLNLNDISNLLKVEQEDGGAGANISAMNVVVSVLVVNVLARVLQVVLIDSADVGSRNV